MKIPRKPVKINPVRDRSPQGDHSTGPEKSRAVSNGVNPITLLVDNVRSSENVGSFFRTADAVGVERVCLVGISPQPLDKFNRPDSKIAKTALGAEKDIPYEYYKTMAPCIKKLKKEGYIIVALELSKNSIDYRDLLKQKDVINNNDLKMALIVGNEVTGIKPAILKYADYVVQIPMRGKKESLNVSVATGIMLYEMARLW